MKKSVFLMLACASVFASCNKNDDSKDLIETFVKNEMQVKVYDTQTWNAQTNRMDTVVGATVSLISDSVTVTAVTNNEGIATFENVKSNFYNLIVVKGDKSNLINRSSINGEIVGNLVIGVYVDPDMASYFNSAVGQMRLEDVNGDGRLNDYDISYGQGVRYDENYKDVNNDGLIDVRDIVDGNLIKIDQLVKVNTYIGK